MAIHDSKSRILKDIGRVTAANYLAAAITFAGHIIFRRYISPEEYGVWEMLIVILSYITAAELGLNNGMSKELPFYLGRNDTERARSVQDSVATVVLAMTGVIALSLFAASFFLAGRYPAEWIWGLRFLSAIAVLSQAHNLYITLLKSYKDFATLSVLRVLYPLLMTLFSFALIYRFGIYGLFAGNVLAVVCSLAYVARMTGYGLRPRADLAVLKPVFRVGLVMFVWGYLSGIFLTLDRLLIAKYFGAASLGLYSIATMVQSAMTNFPRSISSNMYPRIIQAYGRNGDPTDVARYVVVSARMLACLAAFLMGVSYFAVELPVRYLLPDYAAGLGATKILIIGTGIISLRYTFEHLLVAVNRVGTLAVLQAPAMAAMAGLSYLALKAGYGMEGVAVAMSLSFLLYTALVVFCSNSILGATTFETSRLFAKLLAPYGLVLLVILFVDGVSAHYSPGGGYATILMETALTGILTSPLPYYVNKRTGAVSALLRRGKPVAAGEEV